MQSFSSFINAFFKKKSPEQPEWAEQIDQPYRLTFENWRQE